MGKDIFFYTTFFGHKDTRYVFLTYNEWDCDQITLKHAFSILILFIWTELKASPALWTSFSIWTVVCLICYMDTFFYLDRDEDINSFMDINFNLDSCDPQQFYGHIFIWILPSLMDFFYLVSTEDLMISLTPLWFGQ